MAKNYAALASSVITALGSTNNISVVTHCMIHLYFIIKDDQFTNSPMLKTISDVPGVIHSDNQCQVIISNTVSQAFQEVINLLPEDLQPAPPVDRLKLMLRRTGAGTLDALISTMSPLIPTTVGESMVKLLAIILGMGGVPIRGSLTLIILNMIGDGAFFLLSLVVVALVTIKFRTNTPLAITTVSVLAHPSLIGLMVRVTLGEHVEFTPIPAAAVKYVYIVIPVLVMTWRLPCIERWVDSIMPAMTKNFLKPMLIMLITAPLAVLLIGLIGIWIGSAISVLAYTIHGYLGWLSVATMGALWPLLVMTGMHRVFTPIIIQTIAETGKERMVIPSKIGTNPLLGGSSLVIVWKTKNLELRQTTLATAASAITAGISEPALYGMAIRLKRPLVTSLINGSICGAAAGMTGLASYSVVAPGSFISVQFFDPTNLMGIAWVFAVMALTVMPPSILTLPLGLEDIPVEETAAEA